MKLVTLKPRLARLQTCRASRLRLACRFLQRAVADQPGVSARRAAALRLRRPSHVRTETRGARVVDARAFIEHRLQQHLHFHQALVSVLRARESASSASREASASRLVRASRLAVTVLRRDQGRLVHTTLAREWMRSPMRGGQAGHRNDAHARHVAEVKGGNAPASPKLASIVLRLQIDSAPGWPADRSARALRRARSTSISADRAGRGTSTVNTASDVAFLAAIVRTRATRQIVRSIREDEKITPIWATHSTVRLVWRKPPTAASETNGQSVSIEHANIPIRTRPAQASAVSQDLLAEMAKRPTTAAQHIDSTVMDRVAEDVIRRIDKRARIERERRGL
jgi:hypothetical protein